jgi:hypothetical protein
MGDKASILLLFALAHEATLFQLGVEVHGTTVGEGTQPSARGQRRQRFENLDEWLRRLQPSRIHFNDGSAGARTRP